LTQPEDRQAALASSEDWLSEADLLDEHRRRVFKYLRYRGLNADEEPTTQGAGRPASGSSPLPGTR